MGWKDEIQHVVVLMLENQSFDRLLGCLRHQDNREDADRGTDPHNSHHIPHELSS